MSKVLMKRKVQDAYEQFKATAAAPSTKLQYDLNLTRYMNYLREKLHLDIKSHNDLIYSDFARGVKHDKDLMKDWLEEYVKHLKGQKLKRSSVLGPVWACYFFYERANGVELPWPYFSSKAPREGAVKKPRGYTQAIMQQMIDVDGDLRTTALIHFLSSTGVRKGTLVPEFDEEVGVESPGLFKKHLHKLNDLLPDELEYAEYRKYKGYLVVCYEGTSAEYFTFTTPESAASLDAYFAHRGLHGETIGPDSPIFRPIFGQQNAATGVEPLSIRALFDVFGNLQYRIGLRKPSKVKMTKDQARRLRHDIPAVHGFRKYMNTTLQNCKLHHDLKRFLMGHDCGLDEHYYDFTIPASVVAALQEYLKAVPKLTISETNRLKDQLQEKQKIDETNLRSTVAQMVHSYMSRRDRLVEEHPTMTAEEWAKEMEEIEKLNPLDRLGIDRNTAKYIA